MTTTGRLQIGEVATRVGLSLRTLRHWDEEGVVVPSGRSQGGFRLYTEDDVDRLLFAKTLKPLAFTLEEMRELVQLRDAARRGAGDDGLGRLEIYAEAAERRCEILRDQLLEAEQVAADLRRTLGRPGPGEQGPTDPVPGDVH